MHYMKTFNLTLTQMLMMFSFILVGIWLRKKKIVPDNSDVTISRIETFVLVPALTFYNQLKNCNVENFLSSAKLMLYGLGLVVIAIIVSYPLSKLFEKKSSQNKENEYQRNIYKYALTFGNFGYMGNFIVLGIWGEEMFFKYTMFTFFPSVLCLSWGLYVLIPKESGESLRRNIVKGLTAPPMLALVLGTVCGIFEAGKFFPGFVMSTLSNASNCMGPLSMILAGIVIGSYDFKSLLSNKKVYVASFMRLIVLPTMLVMFLKVLGTDSELLTLALIAFATPVGLNVIIYPATYGGDTKTGASMTMISHILSVVSIPVMFILLQ